MLNRSKTYNYKISRSTEDTPKPKRNEIVIIPQDNRLLEIPPYLCDQSLPSWWKDLPINSMSLRRCSGTYDYVKYGFIVPAWTDITIRKNASGNGFQYRLLGYGDDFRFNTGIFPAENAKGCPFAENRVLNNFEFPKLVSPWRYFTPKGISLMALPVLHEPNPNYIVMPGIVNTDFYNQLHIVLSVLTDKEFTIKAGTPLQHVIPIKRNENFKKIIFGNETMFKFHIGNGMSKSLGRGCVDTDDNSQLYRKIQKENDIQAELEGNKKWYYFFKK